MRELPKELTGELLELVLKDRLLGGERKVGDNIQLTGDLLHYEVKNCFMDKINIDTLARLMKEWCLVQGFQIESAINIKGGYANVYCAENGYFYLYNTKTVATEFEAVLKATHWVAKEKGLI